MQKSSDVTAALARLWTNPVEISSKKEAHTSKLKPARCQEQPVLVSDGQYWIEDLCNAQSHLLLMLLVKWPSKHVSTLWLISLLFATTKWEQVGDEKYVSMFYYFSPSKEAVKCRETLLSCRSSSLKAPGEHFSTPLIPDRAKDFLTDCRAETGGRQIWQGK